MNKTSQKIDPRSVPNAATRNKLMRPFPLAEVYGLLEPGPVVLLTTSRGNKSNIMTMSWLTMMEFEPPLVGCIVSNRNYSFNLLKTTKECVIALPLAKLARKVVKVGNCSGRDEDKFRTIGLTPLPAAFVRAPLIRECYANLECKVVNTSLVSRYNFFVLEVVKAWVQRTREPLRTIHHRGKGLFMLAGNTVRLPSKMK